jgi:bifunctional non-homologous end joining protein LigD
MKARPSKLGFIEPCFPRLVLKPPTGPEWLHELKYDGWRVQALKSKARVRIFTRRGHDWTDRFGPIGEAIAQLPATTAILDGELVAEDETGRPDFALLELALRSRRTECLLVYFAFDLLHLEGDDLRRLHLIERKVRLAAVLEGLDHPCLKSVDAFHVAGARLLSEACKIGLEEIVSKRWNAPYRSGVRSEWVKTLCRAEELFPIVGYTAGRRGVTELLLGLAGDDGELHYVGRIEHGLNERLARELLPRLREAAPGRTGAGTRLTAQGDEGRRVGQAAARGLCRLPRRVLRPPAARGAERRRGAAIDVEVEGVVLQRADRARIERHRVLEGADDRRAPVAERPTLWMVRIHADLAILHRRRVL